MPPPTDQPPAPEIDVALVRRLIDTQFPHWSRLQVRPVEVSGWDNRTFRLGNELSVRLPSATGYVAQVGKEQRWLPWLASQLPLPIPEQVAVGGPGAGYPFPWTVNRWLAGTVADSTADLVAIAVDLAHFLVTLRGLDPTGGPAPGLHNFHRGGPLSTYAADTHQALTQLDDASTSVDVGAARRVWVDAVTARWTTPPVWFHGDVAAGNLLVHEGRLAAVIDFGCCGVGDPACDVVIAWTLFDGPARQAWRRELDVDDGTWSRGRGWALWKALITLVAALDTDDGIGAESACIVIDRVLADHADSSA